MRKIFTPRISIYRQYDDNIDMLSNLDFARLDPNGNVVNFDKNSDWITTVSPGFLLNLDSQKTKMSLDYETRFTFHHRDSKNDDIFQSGSAQWVQQLTRNLKLTVSDTFSRSDDPILVSEEGLIEEVVGRRIYYRNTGQIDLSMRIGVNSSFDLGYRNLFLNNKSDNYEDSIGHEFFFNLDTRFNPFLGINLESMVNRGRFKQPEGFTESYTEDFLDREGVITLNYRWHPSRSLFVKYSLLAKKYDDPDITEFLLHQISVGLNFALTSHTHFNVEGGYFLQDLADNSEEDGARFNITLNTERKKATVSLGASGGYTQDYFSSENLGSSEFKGIFGSANYLFSKDLRGFLSANYQWNEFFEDNQSNRKDEVWLTTAGFYFSFSDWLTLSMEGSHSERESKSDAVFNRHPEFIRDNRVMLRLSAAHPIIF